MEPGTSGGVTLDISFGFDDPNFSDRILLLDIIDTDDSRNVKRLHSDDLFNNASTHTTLSLSPPPGVKAIHINSLILSARSPFFRKLFSNGMQESEQKHVTLRMEAVEEASFMDLLKFVFSNNLPTTLVALRNLLLMADKFEVDSCSRDCTRALQKLPMTCESASVYLDLPPCLVMSPTVEPRIEAAKNFLVAKFKDLSKLKKEVLKLPLRSLQAVLSNDDLLVFSEIEVYYCVLEWVHNHYPDLEERQQILETELLHLVRFPFMTTTELKEVQTCSDIDPKLASEIVIRALAFKAETDFDRKRCIVAEESNTASRQFVERAYIYRPIKVVHLEFPHPKCVVYLDLTRNELKRMFPEGETWSESFVLGGKEFAFTASCCTDESDNLQYFWVSLDVLETSRCTVKYEVSVIWKPQEEFECWFRGCHTFVETEDIKDLGSEEWMHFIGDDSPYFFNDILHLRADLTIMK